MLGARKVHGAIIESYSSSRTPSDARIYASDVRHFLKGDPRFNCPEEDIVLFDLRGDYSPLTTAEKWSQTLSTAQDKIVVVYSDSMEIDESKHLLQLVREARAAGALLAAAVTRPNLFSASLTRGNT
jgi:hypothetical protein